MGGLVAGLCLAAGSVRACSVPVFRYALERWEADPYELIVQVPGGESPDRPPTTVADWLENLPEDRGKANLTLREEPSAAASPPGGPENPAGLRGTLQFPMAAGLRAPVWEGELDEARLRQLLDSPVRSEIGRRLLAGDSGVWILLESGDGPADDQAAALLKSRLEWVEENLEIAALDPADVAAGLVSVPEAELNVSFSMLRLSRANEAEWALVSMLLGTEGDLREFNEPIALPVFGRGRVLYALIGSGISERNIDRACAFLIGPCSCQAKELNPGVDLLMTVDWEAGITRSIIRSRELPPLAGLASFAAESARESPAEPMPAETTVPRSGDVTPGPRVDGSSVAASDATVQAGDAGSTQTRLGPMLGAVGVIAVLALLAGTWLLLRRGS
jgi:hypothetical protein